MSSRVLQNIFQSMSHVAALHGYPSDRQDLWQDRLQMNLAELTVLESLGSVGSDYYLPARTRLSPGGVSPSRSGSGSGSGIDTRSAATSEAKRCPQEALWQAHSKASEEKLNALIQVADRGQIQDQLDALHRRRQAGAALPLCGMPVVVKDLMAVQGLRQTWGSGHVPDGACRQDARAVALLREAGAIIIGTANLHELAFGITSNNPHYGAVINPRKQDATPGGSSGGSAAAVAAGIVPAAIGTDTAGSIRIPASCCGVTGFKPTYDVISRDGAMTLGATLDHIGPIAATVDDTALLFSIMAGQPAQVPKRLASLEGVGIGLPQNYFYDLLTEDVRQAIHAALTGLQNDGASLHDVRVADISLAPAAQFASLCCEASATHWQRLLEIPETLGPDVRVRLEIGQFIPGIWYTRAQNARARIAAGLHAAMSGLDILITPTLRSTAPGNDATFVQMDGVQMPLHTAMTSLTLPFNLVSMPALTLPCADDATGLPIGLQIVGRPGADWRVLEISKRIESILSYRQPMAD